MQTKTTPYLLIISLAFMLHCYSCKQERCKGPNRKVELQYKDDYVPYQGNEQIRFLHNNIDTQVFMGQGKETYYITDGHIDDDHCPMDYENVRVRFLNQTMNDVFTLAYERDKALFPNLIDWNDYTFYKIEYKNKHFSSEVYRYINDSILINNIYYKHASIIGLDTTTNYVVYRGGIGLLKIKIDSDTWELIP